MSEDALATLFKLMREQTANLSKLEQTVARMDERMRARDKLDDIEGKRRKCEEPGLCLELRTQLEEIKRQRAAEAIEAAKLTGKREGIIVSAKWVWALITGGAFAICFQVWQMLGKK
jgi:hypothetical protein